MAKEKSTEIQKHIDNLRLELKQEIGESRAALLMQRTPKHEIRTRLLNPTKPEGTGNPRFRYVEHSWVTKMLNFAFAFNWDLVVEEIKEYTDQVVVRGYLEVRTKTTTIRKWGIGGAKFHPNSPNEKKADVFNAAQSHMLKRCAMLLGLGIDLYRHEDKAVQEVEEVNVKEATEAGKITDVVIKDGKVSVEVKPATLAQIKTVETLAKAKGVEIDTAGLSEAAAAETIQKLIKDKSKGVK